MLGVGYNLVSDALNGQLALKMMLLLLVLKLVATATCYSSGERGRHLRSQPLHRSHARRSRRSRGSHLLPDQTGNAGAYALVGMGAAFAGIVRTPMTSVIMIFEVTRDYTIIVPLMIANLCSYLLAQKLQRLPIYEALSHQDGITMPSSDAPPGTAYRGARHEARRRPADMPLPWTCRSFTLTTRSIPPSSGWARPAWSNSPSSAAPGAGRLAR